MYSIVRCTILVVLLLNGNNCFPCYIRPQIDRKKVLEDKSVKGITDLIMKTLFSKIYFSPSKNIGIVRVHKAQFVQKGKHFTVYMQISICINGVIKTLTIDEKDLKMEDIVPFCVDKMLEALIDARDDILSVTLLSDGLNKTKQDVHDQTEENCFPFGLKVFMQNKSSIERKGLKGMRNSIIKGLYRTIYLQPMERTAGIYIYSSSFTMQKNREYIWAWIEYSIFVDQAIKDRVFEIQVPLPKPLSRQDFLGKKKFIRELFLNEIRRGLNELKDVVDKL